MTRLKIKICFYITFLLLLSNYAFAQDRTLKLVFIRHGEKPLKGNNLTCKGLNRSLQLSTVLYKKFGVPVYLMVPALELGDSTKHARMFQTIAPFAMKYNLVINTVHQEKDFEQIAADLKGRKGTIIITWEHKAILGIIKALGISETLNWPDNDFDSIWIVTFKSGVAHFIKDKEGLHPSGNCPIY